MIARLATLLATLLALGGRAAGAQAPLTGGAQLRVSILTFGPGSAVFERFGHNAIRITDANTGMDLAFNWGMFSFDDPNFLGRFLSGDTRYWVEPFPARWLIGVYERQDREVVEQVLALTPAQRAALADLATTNAREENKYYRYDYFRDNCSTRVRDALDAVLGGALRRRFEPITTAWTYRSESVRLTTPAALAQAGIDIALGIPADRPISAWESMFIPMRLRDHLREVTVPGPDGTPVPLVAAEARLFEATRAPEPAERRGLALGVWGPVLTVWMLFLVPLSAASRRRTRIPAAVVAGLWYGLTGLVGAILVAMWVGSAHVFWYRNLNLLLLSPVGLVAAVPVARAVLRQRATPLARGLVLAIAALAAAALLVGLVGPQAMGGPLLLLLLPHLALAFAVVRHMQGAAATADADPAARALPVGAS